MPRGPATQLQPPKLPQTRHVSNAYRQRHQRSSTYNYTPDECLRTNINSAKRNLSNLTDNYKDDDEHNNNFVFWTMKSGRTKILKASPTQPDNTQPSTGDDSLCPTGSAIQAKPPSRTGHELPVKGRDGRVKRGTWQDSHAIFNDGCPRTISDNVATANLEPESQIGYYVPVQGRDDCVKLGTLRDVNAFVTTTDTWCSTRRCTN